METMKICYQKNSVKTIKFLFVLTYVAEANLHAWGGHCDCSLGYQDSKDTSESYLNTKFWAGRPLVPGNTCLYIPEVQYQTHLSLFFSDSSYTWIAINQTQ